MSTLTFNRSTGLRSILALMVFCYGGLVWSQTETESEKCETELELCKEDLLGLKTVAALDFTKSSSTSYVDSAIVASQIMVRHDWNLDANRPDRAEFIYGKCDCFDPAGPSPGPAQDLDFQELELTIEHAFTERFSLFTEIPVRTIDLVIPDGVDGVIDTTPRTNSGIGDIRAGFKYAAMVNSNGYLTVQVRGYFPTGDASENLGTDHASIEPALLYYKELSDRWTLESEARWWHPLGGSSDPVTGTDSDGFAGDVLRFGVGMSYDGWGTRVRVSPVAELVGWYVLDGFKTIAPVGLGYEDASGDTIVNLKLGARIQTSPAGSFYLSYGFALTNEIWYDSIFRVGYRYNFGRKPGV